MSIQITITADNAAAALAEMKAFIGAKYAFEVKWADAIPNGAAQTAIGPAAAETTVEAAEKPKRGRGKAKPAEIAAPVEETADTVAADATDEQAEEEASHSETYTRDDLRAAMLAYQQKYGTTEVLADAPKIAESVLGPIPAGTKTADGRDAPFWTLSTIPEDRIADVLAKFKAAVVSGEFRNG